MIKKMFKKIKEKFKINFLMKRLKIDYYKNDVIAMGFNQVALNNAIKFLVKIFTKKWIKKQGWMSLGHLRDPHPILLGLNFSSLESSLELLAVSTYLDYFKEASSFGEIISSLKNPEPRFIEQKYELKVAYRLRNSGLIVLHPAIKNGKYADLLLKNDKQIYIETTVLNLPKYIQNFNIQTNELRKRIMSNISYFFKKYEIKFAIQIEFFEIIDDRERVNLQKEIYRIMKMICDRDQVYFNTEKKYSLKIAKTDLHMKNLILKKGLEWVKQRYSFDEVHTQTIVLKKDIKKLASINHDAVSLEVGWMAIKHPPLPSLSNDEMRLGIINKLNSKKDQLIAHPDNQNSILFILIPNLYLITGEFLVELCKKYFEKYIHLKQIIFEINIDHMNSVFFFLISPSCSEFILKQSDLSMKSIEEFNLTFNYSKI